MYAPMKNDRNANFLRVCKFSDNEVSNEKAGRKFVLFICLWEFMGVKWHQKIGTFIHMEILGLFS